jgi:hypothetical protein
MSIEKLMNRTNENIISSIGEKSGVFFFFLAASSLSFSFSFYFLGNPNPHIPPFVSSKKKNPCQSRQFTFK